jgi:hypothetical protein
MPRVGAGGGGCDGERWRDKERERERERESNELTNAVAISRSISAGERIAVRS